MAASLLQSTSSSFHGQCSAFHPTASPPRNSPSLLPLTTARATAGAAVKIDKSESETTYRLKNTYIQKIIPLLKDEFSYNNIHQVPKIVKIVVNCGIGDAEQNKKGLDGAVNEFALVAGQKPVKTVAKKSIAGFKVREGQTLGIAVTLRGNVMYAFLDRLINLALPRTRDFQGVNPNSFDGHGNYSLGLNEQSVFPELTPELIGKARGMDVCITTTAKTDKEAYRLLELMGMPFRESSEPTTNVVRKKLKSHHFSPRYGRK